MATRVKTRQGKSSQGLDRLELEDGQGQLEEINCMDVCLHSFDLFCLHSFDVYAAKYLILVQKQPGRQANL